MSSCFLIGHRKVPGDILPDLTEAVERHITEFGATEFVIGSCGSFDHMAQQVIAEAKERHPEISLSLLLPCCPVEQPPKVPAGFHSLYYPPGTEQVPRRFANIRANRYMAARADYLIAYAWHPASNAWSLVEFARGLGVPVTNLGNGRIQHTAQKNAPAE